ncbi:MAG: putative Signal transduction histidine kinase containing PAS domain [Promethearchaeota archaeon]|nr:MAG: putative Signal transduction histidine kinase containing PAS domain [Candidatus Lokiarchaeota archaeon]
MQKNKETIPQLDIPDSILDKWQQLIDALARLMEVPAAFVMKIDYPFLKALIRSRTKDNPIPPNYEEKIFGTYCETTINLKKIHIVPNAFKDPNYSNKPGLNENKLISYLGFPLEWPTGDVFGTICVVDQKEREFTQEQKDLMREMKVSVDAHLELIFKNHQLQIAQQKIKEQRDNLRLLTSTVRHDIANNLTYIYGFLQLKLDNTGPPDNVIEELIPYVKSSIESIDYIKKLEELFTKEKKFKPLNPRDILEKIKRKYPERISIKGSCTINADEFLELLLRELVRNVVKHTEDSQIEIILVEDKNTSMIHFQDYGPGLPESIVDSHFRNSRNQRELKGLTIIEKIMSRYGGTILYEKNEKGALFKLIWHKNRD